MTQIPFVSSITQMLKASLHIYREDTHSPEKEHIASFPREYWLELYHFTSHKYTPPNRHKIEEIYVLYSPSFF